MMSLPHLVDAHGPFSTAYFPVFSARAGLVAVGLAVPVEVDFGVTAPALSAVLGRDELVTLAVFRAFLNIHREQSRVGVPQRASTTAARSRWVGARDIRRDRIRTEQDPCCNQSEK